MPFDNLREEDLGVAAGAGPFAKLLRDVPASDAVLEWLLGIKAYHVNPRNWCDTGPLGDNDSVCIAVAAARICGPNFSRVLPYLNAAPPSEARGHGRDPIVYFNECMGTTHPELMAFYDRAITARRAELAS